MNIPTRLRRVARGALVAAVALPLVAGLAAARDLFTVQGVALDESAENAVAAQEAALVAGQRDALAELMRRLTSPDEWSRLPGVGGLAIGDYVASYEIASEQVGSTRYIGTLDVLFRPEPVERLLSNAGIAFVERGSPPILVLPVRDDQARLVLGESDPWRDAWSSVIETEPLLDIVLPLGDLEDLSAVDAIAAEGVQGAAADALRARYGAREIVLATAYPPSDPAAGEVSVALTSSGELGLVSGKTSLGTPAGDEQWQNAALATLDVLQEDWKRENLLRFDQLSEITAEVPVVGLGDWVALRGVLDGIAAIRRVDIESMSTRLVVVRIAYAGDRDRLASELERGGVLVAQEGAGWQLRPAGAGLARRV